MGRWIWFDGKGRKQGLPVDQLALPHLLTSDMPQINQPHIARTWKEMKETVSCLSVGCKCWCLCLPASFCASSGLTEEPALAGPPLLMFLLSAQCLNQVRSVMLSGNLCGLVGLTFSCLSCTVQTRPADTLGWGCSFTAVLTEVTICLAGRGCLLWVMPLQLVSAFSNCCVANDSKKKKTLCKKCQS